MSASLAGAVMLGARSPALGVVFGAPAFAWCLVFAHAIAQGYPRGDALAATELEEVLRELGNQPLVTVVVQDQMGVGMTVRRGSRPRLVAALSFVQKNDDVVLRGAAALALSELLDENLTRRSAWLRRTSWAVYGLAIAAVILLVPDAGALAPLAPLGLAGWIASVALSAWTRRRAFARAYVHADNAAARLAGNESVLRALSALTLWRDHAWARLGPTGRVLARCVQPVRPDWHESARAQRLREQLSPQP